jgi:hypothetical protein
MPPLVLDETSRLSATTGSLTHRTLGWTTGVLLTGAFVAAAWMRFAALGMAASRDYDEGVYWQTLRAMAHGHELYRDVFFSQPPAFLLFVFPIYEAGGSSIWSARLAVALLSLLGILGVALIGKSVAGNVGVVAAAVLLIVNRPFLAASRELMAEASAVALSLIAVGLASACARDSDERRRIWWSALAGAALAAAILSKMLVIATAIPVALFLALRPPRKHVLMAFGAGFLIVTIALLLPFAGAWNQLIDQVVRFHTATAHVVVETTRDKLRLMWHDAGSPLGAAALIGLAVGLARRHQVAAIGLLWLIGTAITLITITPLWLHHTVALDEPMTVLALCVLPWQNPASKQPKLWFAAAIAVLVVTVVASAAQQELYYRRDASLLATSNERQVAKYLHQRLPPQGSIIADGQFAVALADRDTPPWLVDTSAVRTRSGYLTSGELITGAKDPNNVAVLFTNRNWLREVPMFLASLTPDYHRARVFGLGEELWTRRAALRGEAPVDGRRGSWGTDVGLF